MYSAKIMLSAICSQQENMHINPANPADHFYIHLYQKTSDTSTCFVIKI